MAGRTPLGNMIIELGLDSTKLGDSLTAVKNQLKNFEKQVKTQKGIASFYKEGAEASKAYAKQKQALTEAFKSQRQILTKLNDDYKKNIDETGKASQESQKLEKQIKKLEERYVESVKKTGDTSEASQKLGIELQELQKEYEETVERTGKMTSANQRLAGEIEAGNAKLVSYATQLKEVARESYLADSKLHAFGQKLAPVGQGLLRTSSAFDVISDKTRGMSIAIAAGMGLSIKSAIEFESAFAGVTKTVDEQKDANGRVTYSYERLSNEIRGLAKTLPATTTEIAAVAEAAGQLGIETPNIIDFTKTMIDLGESTNLSATDAATALAKFQNITQMSQKDFGRLGSVIVDLGNNMATTERDITEMGLRLASTGKLVGLSEAQIVALAATLSAVGMEAEAGGSAMSRVMQKMNTAVAEGKGSLEKFASVAGVSAQEFAAKWKSEPQNAIVDFLNGLRRIKKAGGDVTQTLKNMKISNVRDIDSLQRLAGAGDELSKAFDRAGKAWENNIALTDEANKRYATTESKLKIFRNKLNDVAITLGGPLLDALSEGLDAAEPFIKSLTDMAKGFSSMDKASQQSVIKMGLVLAGISPLAKGISNLTGFLGSSVTGVSNLMTWLAKLGGEKAANKAMAELAGLALESSTSLSGVATTASSVSGVLGNVGTAASGAGGQLGLMAKAGAFLSSPAVWVAGGLAVAGVLTYWAAEAGSAYQRTQEWGAKVDKVQAEELQQFKSKVDETNKAMATFATDAVSNVEEIKTAFSGLVTEISKLADEELTKNIELAEKLGLGPEVIEALKLAGKAVKDNVQHMSDEVIAIYQNAKEQRRELTQEEKQIVLTNQNELIRTQLELMKFSGEEQIAMTKAMNGQLDELNQTQRIKALELTRKWIEEENKSYEEKKQNYQKLHDEITGTDEKSVQARELILKEMERLEAEHIAKMDTFGQKYAEIQKKVNDSVLEYTKDPTAREAIFEATRRAMEKLGLSYEELMEKATTATTRIQEGHSMWAETLGNASEEARLANAQWNELTWDLKEGKLKTNAQEEIQKALQAENGWEQIKFIAKEANLDTNARIAIGEALIATGQWEQLSLVDKQLVVNGNPAIEAIVTSKEHLAIWNSMPEEVKALLGENAQFLSSAEAAKSALYAWNFLTPTQKALMAKNLTSGDVALAQQTIDSLVGKTVDIHAVDKTLGPVSEAQKAINEAMQLKPIDINAVNQTEPEVAKAEEAVNRIKQKEPISMKGSDDTAPSVAQVNASVNSPRQVAPVSMLGRDNTAPTVNQVNASVNSPRQKNPVGISAQDNTYSGVASARASVNSVQDRTVTITTIFKQIGKALGFEKGTDHHPGGLSVVNDQKGPLYKELITLPNGKSFIPEGRDVLLNLPRGSKVLTASRTKNLMGRLNIPHYATGVGIPEDAKIFRDMDRAEKKLSSTISIQQDNRILEGLLKEIVQLLTVGQGQQESFNVTVKLGDRSLKDVTTEITRIQERNRQKMFRPQ